MSLVPKVVNKYLSLIDDIITDFLKDIKSLRYQLILLAYSFNIYLIVHSKSDTVILGGIGLLSAVYGFYFYSKFKQAEAEKELSKAPVAD